MKNLFLIIGAPGSGKTTDASLIAEQDAKFAHFSTGDLLRAEVASGSELGKQIDGFISKGNFVLMRFLRPLRLKQFRQNTRFLRQQDTSPLAMCIQKSFYRV